MTIVEITVNGRKYPIAPVDPELHDHPTPAYLLAVTPEVARAWLGYNWRNRSQREAGKRDYSADMADGNFAINGTTITFSRPLAEGEDPDVPAGKPVLMDGQHRLEACVQSKSPFVTYVAFGIDPAVRPTIDTGIKRQFSDVLQLRGESNTIVLASVVRKVHAWKGGDYHLTMKKVTATNTQMAEFFQEHPELRRSAQIASRVQGEFQLSTGQSIRQSVTGLAHWLFMAADETLAPEFFARVGDGADMKTQHPIMHLRRRVVKDQTVRKQIGTRREIAYVPDWQMLCYFIRTWNAYLRWEVSTDKERENFKTFAMLGGTDQKRIPLIRTLGQVEQMLDSGEDGDDA
jgi:hypothetical protein